MRLVVQDANIIIDLIECDLFERFFRLDVEVVTTSLVLGEITEPSQRKHCEAAVRKTWLQVKEISTIEYLQLQALDLPGLSVPDRSVLELAASRQATLMTGDGKLRKTAVEHTVDVNPLTDVFLAGGGKRLTTPLRTGEVGIQHTNNLESRIEPRQIPGCYHFIRFW